MLETGTSGLMSGDEKRGVASASAPALVLDSTRYYNQLINIINAAALSSPKTGEAGHDREERGLLFLRSEISSE